MIVPINEQYRIITDPYQWIVQKKRARKDKDDWESVTYHPTFQSAVQSLGELMVRRSDAATLARCIGGCGIHHHHALPGTGTRVF